MSAETENEDNKMYDPNRNEVMRFFEAAGRESELIFNEKFPFLLMESLQT